MFLYYDLGYSKKDVLRMYVLQEFLKERLRTYYRATYVLASISGVRFYLVSAADSKQGQSLFSSTTSWAPGKNIQNH